MRSTAPSTTGTPSPATVGRGDVATGLRRLGISAGDTVFFHSSLSSLGHVNGGAPEVISGFLDAVGTGGTVAAPTFTLVGRVGPFGSWYHHDSSLSTVGLITETLRLWPGAVRSFHPVHSVAALGLRSLPLTDGHRHARGRVSPWCDAAFAHDSPLDLLVRWNAWYVLLGVTFHVQTLLHYVETILADAVLRRAAPDERTGLRQGIRRWALPGVWASLDRVPLGEALLHRDVYASTTVGDATVYAARCRPLVAATLNLVLGDAEKWLNPSFRAWMRDPLDPTDVLDAYTNVLGAPPLDAPLPDLTCLGQVSPR